MQTTPRRRECLCPVSLPGRERLGLVLVLGLGLGLNMVPDSPSLSSAFSVSSDFLSRSGALQITLFNADLIGLGLGLGLGLALFNADSISNKEIRM